MAYGLPGSAFCGVDLSRGAIARARELATALGLDNLDLRHADLAALPPLGTFDYVVAHGVYSWVAPAERDALLAACRSHLAPHGVAYVSYDVLPGGHLREITRQMLRWHLREVSDPEEGIAQARALLAAIAEARPEGDEMRLVAERALQQGDPALFHDELAPHHEAVLFADFAAHAARHGLRFLAEADVFEMDASPLPEELRAGDELEREQYLDFFKGRMFRQTLLCHAAAEPAPGRTGRGARHAGRHAGPPDRRGRARPGRVPRSARRDAHHRPRGRQARAGADRRRVAGRRPGRRAGR